MGVLGSRSRAIFFALFLFSDCVDELRKEEKKREKEKITEKWCRKDDGNILNYNFVLSLISFSLS